MAASRIIIILFQLNEMSHHVPLLGETHPKDENEYNHRPPGAILIVEHRGLIIFVLLFSVISMRCSVYSVVNILKGV